MITLSEAFNLALRQQRAGRLKEARNLYLQILAAQPSNHHALHYLSRIEFQEGHIPEAMELIGRALAAEPAYAEAHLDLGNMLTQQGRLDEAVSAYRTAIALKPEQPQAYINLGTAFKKLGRAAEAIASFQAAVALNPALTEAHHKLGVALHEDGQLDVAIASFEKVIALSPANASVHAILGDRYRQKQQLDRAVAAYRRAIALKPDWAEVYNSLGEALRKQHEFSQAIAACRQAIALRPDFAPAHNNLGNVLKDTGQLEAAIAAYQRANELDPRSAAIINNLGVALKDTGRLDAAETAFRRAILLDPNYADAYNNLCACQREQGRLEEAIISAREAIRLDPNFAIAHYNLAMSLLTGSDLATGWEEQEWRWKCTDFPSKERGFAQPLWDGADLNDRTLLLHAEQGFGDTIQFIRYLPMVAARGRRIIVECQPELVRLLQPFSSICRIVPRGDALPPFDVHCPLLSLPRIFKTRLHSIPADVPYLFSEPDLVQHWRAKLQSSTAEFKVGLAWAGNRTFSSDRTRSLTLDRYAPLAAVGGATFYSLQKGYAAAQAARPPTGMNLIDLSGEIDDFVDTAAIISSIELVITTDTSVAHLAGALGKPVWTLLRFAADWRWFADREDSPWYPSMRLFRQHTAGDWEEVIGRVVAALDTEMKKRRR